MNHARGPPTAQGELRPLANPNDSPTTTKPDLTYEVGLLPFCPAVIKHCWASSKT